MKVLHCEHMGVGVILSRALRQLGVDSRVLSSAPHPFGFKEDLLFIQNAFVSRYLRRFDWMRFFGFDILHSHDNVRLPSNVLRRWRGALIQHYHDPNTKGPLYPGVPSLVSLPNILRAVPDATWVPIPVDTEFFKPRQAGPRDHVCIGYCDQTMDPKKSPFIPKDEIETTVKRLGGKVRTLPLKGVLNHGEMPGFYEKIDVWVDRIGLDFYGFAAVEAASMGIPVITDMGGEEKRRVPDCPFLCTGRKGVPDAVAALAQDENLRLSLGRKAREYAVAVHDSVRAARICLEQYGRLGPCTS